MNIINGMYYIYRDSKGKIIEWSWMYLNDYIQYLSNGGKLSHCSYNDLTIEERNYIDATYD